MPSPEMSYTPPQSPSARYTPRKPVKKGSMSSLRDAMMASSPISRLRNKFFSAKASTADDDVEDEVLNISHAGAFTEDPASPSAQRCLPHRSLTLKVKVDSPSPPPSPYQERHRPFAQSPSPSLNRSRTLPHSPSTPLTPFTPPLGTPRSFQSPTTPTARSKLSNKPGVVTRLVDSSAWGSPSFILAVDPEWDSTRGEATLFIFPQDRQYLQGDGDCVTLEEIWTGFFPGVVCDDPSRIRR